MEGARTLRAALQVDLCEQFNHTDRTLGGVAVSAAELSEMEFCGFNRWWFTSDTVQHTKLGLDRASPANQIGDVPTAIRPSDPPQSFDCRLSALIDCDGDERLLMKFGTTSPEPTRGSASAALPATYLSAVVAQRAPTFPALLCSASVPY